MKIQNDQFYTKRNVAADCFKILKNNYPELLENSKIIEPSAGTGSFVEAFINDGIEKDRIYAFDIDPKHPLVVTADFFDISFDNHDLIAIGNPPFGKRSKLAIKFFNHAAKFCHTIAFIVPVQFQKYGVQSHLDKDFRLIYEELLNPTSFENNGKDLTVRSCFQIWTKKDGYQNLRIKEKPATSHPDFEMFLYNNTAETRKYFDYDWDFAVPRQGFYDYSLRITDKKELNPRVQYMFFKGSTPEVTQRLSDIDFERLSLNNTTIKGFGKADVVNFWTRFCQNNSNFYNL